MFLKRKNLRRTLIMVDTVKSRLHLFEMKKGRGSLLETAVYVIITLNCITDCRDSIVSTINFLDGMYFTRPFIFVSVVTPVIQMICFYHIVEYNLIATLTQILKSTVRLIDSTFIKTSLNDINSVLPVVEGDTYIGSFIPYTGQSRSMSSHRCSSCYYKIHHYQKILKVSNEIRMATVLTNLVYHDIVALIIIVYLLYLPTEFIHLFNKNYDSEKHYYFTSHISLAVCWIFPIVATIFIYEWTKHKNREFAVKASRKCFSVGDVTEKKLLSRLINSTSTNYPESLWYLISLEYTLLSTFVDVTVLIGTTFIAPSG
ncbi:hypothetical protein J6590_005150 [Homalodisca vitripennis]|nr:hypothetical protein J6590_005150 [Homalodisca vitripennis]